MSTLRERMRALVEETGWSVGKIATVADVSSSAVSQWLNGQSASIKIEPAEKLERETGFSALWLSKGKGPKKPTATAPRTVPVGLLNALTILRNEIESAPESARRSAVMLVAQYLENPSDNSDMLSLIARRLSGESPEHKISASGGSR